MNKCMAADKPCTCQPTAGNVCAEVIALRKDAERYRWLREDPPLRLSVRKFPGDTDAGCYLDGQNLDVAVDIEMAAPQAVGAA